jgi:hypothetical protein
MQENTLPSGGPEARVAVRVNLFMAATLHASGTEIPVKIRDLSATGAQIESAVLPDVGSAITLARGRLSVQGRVTWSVERRCGLQFTARISVQDWMANPVNRQQQRVDHVVASVKAGAVPLVAPVPRVAGAACGVAEDLMRVSQLLESLGDALANDPAIIAQHGTALQNLDIAMQTLTALAETTQKDSAAESASIARLDELRASCAEALRGSA